MYKKEDNIYIIKENCVEIQVQYKKEWISCYIDLKDLDVVKQYHWRTSHKKNKIYICTGGKRNNNLTYLHKLIYQINNLNVVIKNGWEIDHIDCNSLNNRISNLRLVTRLQNIQNTSCRIDNKIGIRGISYSKHDKNYTVDFSFNKNRFYFNKWKTIEEAVYCRKYAEEYFGLNILNRNPLSAQYLILNAFKASQIQEYTYQIIKEKLK